MVVKQHGLIRENTENPEAAPSNDLKSEDNSIPGEWVAQIRYHYERYKNTKDLNERQKLLNLGWNPDQIPTDDMIEYIIQNKRAENGGDKIEKYRDPNVKPEDHVTYESDESILQNTDESEPLPVPADWYNRILFLYDQYKNTNGEQFKSEMIQMGWNPEIEPSIENIKRLIKHKEETEPEIIDLTEGVIIDSPNTAYNYDNWENGKSNVILITGLSGSGKTTLAKAIAKEDEAILIQLDMFQCYNRFKESNIFNPSMVYVEKYLKANPKAKELDFSDIRLEGFGEAFLDYFDWLLRYMAKDKKNKYVVEGIHILLFVKYSSIKKYPLICMGTSMSKSLIRRWIRDQFSIADLAKYGYGEIKLWKDWEDQYQEFKDSIQEMVNIFPKGWFREHFPEIDFDSVDLDAARGPIDEGVKSSIDTDHKQKGKKALSDFHKIKVTKKLIDEFKGEYKYLKHIDHRDDAYIFFDDDNKIVGVIAVEHKDSDYEDGDWITALEVSKEYQGYGLGTQLLDFAVKNLHADSLSVNRNNEVAIRMYEKYGFKYNKNDTGTMIYMHLKGTVNESQADLTKFTWYHAEIAKKGFNAKIAGGWDEELYSKSIESCIHNDIEGKAEFKGVDKISAHLYTAGEDLSAIYLGRISVWKASDTNKLNWEWEEQIPMKSSDIVYLKDEVQPHLLESFEYIEEGYLNQLFMSVPIKAYNAKNKTPINNMGDLLKYHKNPGLVNYVKNCKKIEDLRYIKKDSGSHMIIPQIKVIKERISLCKELGECDKTKSYYKGIKKLYLDRGITEKDCDATIEWCKELDKLIADKIAELKKEKVSENTLLESVTVNEFSDIITEGIIKNEKDIYYNKDKFDSGEINLCFITGHSGSGKSTMGRGMAKDNIEHYELDDLIQNYNFSDDNLKEYGDLIYSFFKGPGKKYRYYSYDDLKKCTNPLDDSGDEFDKCVNTDFINYAIKYSKSHPKTKFVIEGIWIFFFIAPDKLKDYAVFIKGTSHLLSSFRAAKRDSGNEKDKIKRFIYTINGTARNLTDKCRIDGEKAIKKYRDYFSKKSSNESSVEDYLDDDEWDEIEEWTPVSFLSKKTSQAKNKKAHRDYLKRKQKSHKKKYNFFHKHEAALYEDMKNNIIEAEPIFIVNSFTNTPFGKIITTYTHSNYSHTAISLDTSLTHMYSFNADNKKNAFGGFSIESIKDYIAYYKDSIIQVNCIFIKKSDMDKIKFVLDNMTEHIPDTRYGFKNIFNIVLNKTKEMTNDAKVMVCSQFVAYILHNTADIRLVNKSDNLVTPKDLSTIDNPRVYKLYEGKAIDYDEKKINRIFRKLKTKAMIIKESLINY